jgi:low affinity Fe/Cu permease
MRPPQEGLLARKQAKQTPPQARPAPKREDVRCHGHNGVIGNGHNGQNPNSWSQLFSRLACETARLAGKPVTFLIALLAVLVWAATGPLFGYSDTWQLVINTSTTIVTFLMVFLIQHTQNRDTLAVQLKLAELIIAVREAKNEVAVAEDLSVEELEQLHEEYRRRAEQALGHLTRRRGDTLKRAS